MAAGNVTFSGTALGRIESDTTVRRVSFDRPRNVSLVHISGEAVFISFLGGNTIDTSGDQIEGTSELASGDSIPLPKAAGFHHRTATLTGKFKIVPLD